MMQYRSLVAMTALVGTLAFSSPAFAQCTVPNVITNGQVADATDVMENFDAVASCVDEAVSPTGAMTVGAIAVVSGAKTVTSGDLSGDVTTSGGATTTLSDSGVTPGTYLGANITVDSKGRITTASSGPGTQGSSWVLISHMTISSATPSVEFTDLGDYSELLVYGSQVTSSISGQRVVRVSVDNGNSYYSASGDYFWITENGGRVNGTAAIFHNTASSSARDFFGVISASNVNGTPKFVRNIDESGNHNRIFHASLLPINAISITNNAGGNLTSGSIYVLGR